jgi:hypothetical protein
MELTQAQLKHLYFYEPETGAFVHKETNKIQWQVDERGYVRIRINKKRYRAHRLAFLYMTGQMPKNIDHINGKGADNRWVNLRECTQAQNCRNRKVSIDTKSGIKNVIWHEESKRWKVVICCNGKQYDYGFFYDLDIAELVAIGARVKYHGEFARID